MEHIAQNIDLVALTLAFVQLVKPIIKEYLPEVWHRLVIVCTAGIFGVLLMIVLYYLPENLFIDGGLYGFAAAGLVSLAKEFTKKQ